MVEPIAAASAFSGEVSQADLQAALRSLGFLTALEKRSAIQLGVVYSSNDPEAKSQAQRVAAMLGKLSGPGSASVQVSVLSVQEAAQSSQHVDALYLLPLPYDSGKVISDAVKRQGVVSISPDPACLEMSACVLYVQTRPTMTIVLDTALAQAAGARFSTVFTMMVKRR
ncbi:hypothetical protein FHS83_000649 [Rhizomicrobium palustre]|uniref:DUF4154 domain-containing protein n=1 Tax=Rhizomicrobium palustre TaxID=189966 RepID=A0A846MVZ5_9PROT|nr:hypothetical protein [Rhizomicrobium palustre]NIK87331.1 hypothetical protein [Rhizomicrobium palustre]